MSWKAAERILQVIAFSISTVITIVGAAPQIVLAQTAPESSQAIDLNPNPNPLYLPVKPEEVTLQATQKISLNQAIAQRNQRELQIARLTLTRTEAALRQAQAANLPTLGVTGQLGSDRQ